MAWKSCDDSLETEMEEFTMSRKISRRGFLKSAAAGGLGFVFLRNSSSAFGYTANEKLNVAVIGCGGMGKGDMNNVGKLENIYAVCDVRDEAIADALKDFPNAKPFVDYRVMLGQIGDKIDAVTVSTPDHSHAPASSMAIRMGKGVYCQKPLTHSIQEARALRDLARKHKVATQMGNQGTASNGMREAVEVIRAGTLGEVFEVHVWTDRPIWPQGVNRPTETPPVPGGLNWDCWLGPAPFRPYADGYQPFKWRGWIDFGTGALGDMACHTMNIAYMALDLNNPLSVEAEVVNGLTSESYPKSSVITWLFGERSGLRSCRMKWYDGGLKPSKDLLYGDDPGGCGLLVVGTKGRLLSSSHNGDYQLLPKDKFAGFTPPAPTLPRSPRHHEEWTRAVKTGSPTMSNFDYACGLTETVLLGNLAVLTGEPIYWDAANMRAANCPKADQYIQRECRRGWTV